MVKFVLTSWIILQSSNITRRYYTYKKGSLSVERFFRLTARFFWYLEQADRFNSIRRKSPQNHLFSLQPTFLHWSDEKKSALDKQHANRIGAELTAPCGTTRAAKKEGETDFLAGKSASCGRHAHKLASLAQARALRLSLARRECSLVWPKGLNWISLN